MVHAVLDGHAHTTLKMALNMAVEKPGAGVVDVVPHRHPGGPRGGSRSDEAIALRGIDEVEAPRVRLGSLGDAAPVEEAVAGPE